MIEISIQGLSATYIQVEGDTQVRVKSFEIMMLGYIRARKDGLDTQGARERGSFVGELAYLSGREISLSDLNKLDGIVLKATQFDEHGLREGSIQYGEGSEMNITCGSYEVVRHIGPNEE